MNYYAQSIAKWGEIENEDAWCYHGDTSCFVLADGAGGVGIFSKEWAEVLTKSINKIDTPENLSLAIQQLKIDFYYEREKFLEENPNYFSEKFFEEGSAATLIVADFSENNMIKLFAYGDSGYFIFNPTTNSIKTNLTTDHFVNFPTLINCKDPDIKKEAIYFNTCSIEEGDMLILGSDSLAKYLYLIYLIHSNDTQTLEILLATQTEVSGTIQKLQQKSLPTFSETIEEWKEALQSTETFTNYCKRLYDEGIIEYDDYTLIIVRDLLITPKQSEPPIPVESEPPGGVTTPV